MPRGSKCGRAMSSRTPARSARRSPARPSTKAKTSTSATRSGCPYGYTFEGPWQLINQLHEKPWSGSPGIATFLDPSRNIRFGAGDGSPTYWRGPQLEFERWYTFVYRVDLSRNASQGFVEVWLDGVPQTLTNGGTRMYGETIQTPETYLKAGIYRSSTSTGVSIIEHDDIVIGTSYSAVMAF